MQGRFHPYEGYTTATVNRIAKNFPYSVWFLVRISSTSHAHAWSSYINRNMV
jgi:hypothetical protein